MPPTPIHVDWIAEGLPGRIGLTSVPGRNNPVADDLARLRTHYGMTMHVCLLPLGLVSGVDVLAMLGRSRELGIDVRSFPMQVGEAPATVRAARELVRVIVEAARNGGHVVIHCSEGIGRSGVIGGCALVELGSTPPAALHTLMVRRGPCCPESADQASFIEDYGAAVNGWVRPMPSTVKRRRTATHRTKQTR